MSYELYYSPGACSMAIHVLLNELGQDVKLLKADIGGATKDPQLEKVNPRGQVPVLIEDGKALREGGAMAVYLCDKHSTTFIPQKGWERAQALQWLMFANASLHVAYSKASFVKKTNGSEEQFTKATDVIQTMWDEIETQLVSHGGGFICGKNITAGDILITVIANWGFLGRKFNFGPLTTTLLKTVSTRPAYQKALQAENVEYKAAA
jgi:glutathione S-transferase